MASLQCDRAGPYGYRSAIRGIGWEVAYAALFLISNESSYVGVQTLFLDAGHIGGNLRS